MTEQTLQSLLNERVAAFCTSDKPVELIDAAIEKLMKDLMDNAFRSYGDFADAMKAAIKDAMPANVKDFVQLERYNAIIAENLRRRWNDTTLGSSLVEKANKAIDEILTDGGLLQGEVKLSELIKAFLEDNKEYAADSHCEAAEFRMKLDDDGKYLHLYFDKQSDSDYRSEHSSYSSRSSSRSDYELAHAIHMRIEETIEPEKSWGDTHYRGEVYAAKLDEKKIAVDMQIYGKWKKVLASLYFGNANLLIDCNPEDCASYGLYD